MERYPLGVVSNLGMSSPIVHVLVAFLACLGCSPPAASRQASATDTVPASKLDDSARPCDVQRTDGLLRIRCSRSNEAPDWNRVALLLDTALICPVKTASDTAPLIPVERLPMIRPESIVAIDVTRVVPDSIQRRCQERLRKVIYLQTR